jgi:hypothetical protein
MGPEWGSRTIVAYTFIALVLFAFITARLWTCDTMGEVAMAVALAIFVGSVFFYVNKSLFGTESMNFLGLPYLVSKESEGAPIYVCAAETNDPTSA